MADDTSATNNPNLRPHVVDVYAMAARLRESGMSVPVAQYAAAMAVVADVASSLQLMEPGTEQAWDDARRDICSIDDRFYNEQVNRGLASVTEGLRGLLSWQSEAQARRAMAEPDTPPQCSTDFEDMRFWLNGKVPVPLDVGEDPPQGIRALTLATTAKQSGMTMRQLVRIWETVCGDDDPANSGPSRPLPEQDLHGNGPPNPGTPPKARRRRAAAGKSATPPAR